MSEDKSEHERPEVGQAEPRTETRGEREAAEGHQLAKLFRGVKDVEVRRALLKIVEALSEAGE